MRSHRHDHVETDRRQEADGHGTMDDRDEVGRDAKLLFVNSAPPSLQFCDPPLFFNSALPSLFFNSARLPFSSILHPSNAVRILGKH